MTEKVREIQGRMTKENDEETTRKENSVEEREGG